MKKDKPDLQPLEIQPMKLGPVARRIAIRRNVLGNHRTGAQNGAASDLGKLMHADEPADDYMVFNDHMATQGGAIGDDIVMPQDTIVSDMAVHHQQVVIADSSDHSTSGGPGVDGHELSDGVVTADDELAGLALVF